MKTRVFILNTLLLLFIIAGLSFLSRDRVFSLWEQWMEDPAPPAVDYDAFRDDEPTDTDDNTNAVVAESQPDPEPAVIPDEFNLDVPFSSQAPHANWDLPYQEACEEASAINVHYYYQGLPLDADTADNEILRAVQWEEENFGFYKDTTAAKTAEFVERYYGYDRVDVEYDPTIEDIKRHVASGRPVIVPAAGRQLDNPNFTSPGPLYHMFVVRGYTDDTFITNDVGTRNGDGYVYDIDTVMSAMHDWNDGDVDNGRRVIVVIYPNA